MEKRKVGRPRKLLNSRPPLDESFLEYPVLAVLALKPMTTKEVSQTLLMSRETVGKRLRTLESAGHIVQRLMDKRWVLRTRFVPEVAYTPDVHDTPQEFKPSLTQTAQDAPREVQAILAEAEVVGKPAVAPEGAQRIAAAYRVPVELPKLGYVRVFLPGACVVCHQASKLRYGVTAVCPNCAKGWRGLDNV